MNNEAILFAEYISQNHYALCNLQDGICYWKNEEEIKTTYELYVEFKKTI